MEIVTLESVQRNEKINAYIRKADELLKSLGYTEHAFAHVKKTSVATGEILQKLGYPEREQELGRIAAYMHDIGNCINRVGHAQSGALMAFSLLQEMGMEPEEVAVVIGAIGNHDEATAEPINAVAAALILADKSDVRRSRVRNHNLDRFDIHDRVNYAVVSAELTLDPDARLCTLVLEIDTKICPVMDYFEIFLARMNLCKRAAKYLEVWFELVINNVRLL